MANFPTIKSPWQLGRYLIFLLILTAPLWLSACELGGDGALLSEVKLDNPALVLDGKGGPKVINLSYRVGKQSQVSLSLSGPGGVNFELRQNEGRPLGEYSTQINGIIEQQIEGLPQRRLLPDGLYQFILTAKSEGEQAKEQGQFSISGNPSGGAPEVSGLSAHPTVISPNFDAIDDEATLNWRTSRPATVTVSISGKNSLNKTLTTLKNQPAQEDKIQFNGLDLQNKPLPDGTYTYTITASDAYGQETRKAAQIEVKGGGVPQVRVTSVDITPAEIIKGNEVTVKVRVKNTGKVAVRSQGPDSGYSYSSQDVYSSIAVNGQKFDEQAGYWRIGVDFEANASAGAVRYPWRWGFGKEYLQPGEEAEIVGKIRIERPEQKITLYVGLIQEKISLQADRLRVTQVKITY